MPTTLLRIPLVQREISRIASHKLEEKLGTPVKIGSVEFELFNKLVLKELYLEDQKGDTLFSAQRLSAGFDFLPLLKGQLHFSSAQLFTFNIRLDKENDEAPLNIQFVLDAFAKKDTVKKESNIDLNIHTLNIRRGRLTYHVNASPETPGTFNAKHLDIRDISAKLRLRTLTNDSINAEVSKLTMREQSGLEIKRILFNVSGSRKGVQIDDFRLWLPQSFLQLSEIKAQFPENRTPNAYTQESLLSFYIVDSEIAPKDLAALTPKLANYKDKIILDGHVEVAHDNIRISDFELSNGNDLNLSLSVNLLNFSSPGQAYIDGIVRNFHVSAEGLQRTINNFSPEPIALPGQWNKIKNIGFRGMVSGYLRNLSAYGDFSTEGGVLNVDVKAGKNANDRLFIKGHLGTKELDLGMFFAENNPYGKIAFQVDLDAIQDARKKLMGTINANVESFEVKNHLYKNMQFDGDFTHSSFNGKIDIRDDYGAVTAEGYVKLNGAVSEYDFSARMSNVKLDKLNLTGKYPDSNLSFAIEAKMQGNTLDNLTGYAALKDFHFELPDKDLLLDSVNFKASGTSNDRRIDILSDIVQGELAGSYNYSELVPAMQEILHQYLPAVIKPPKKTFDDPSDFRLNLTINNTEKLSDIFNLPITIYKQSHLSGQYNGAKRKFNFEASLPRYILNKIKMEDTKIRFHNTGSKAEFQIDGIRYGKFDVKTDFKLRLTAKDNLLENSLSWRNREKALYEGELFASANFVEQEKEKPARIDIRVKPTHLVFSDTVWTVHPATITIDDKITVNNLNVEHQDQYIRINGAVSKDTTDNLFVDLNKVSLDYIFNSLTIPALELGGIATGKVMVNDVYASQKIAAQLSVDDFSFNDAVIGDLTLSGLWDNEQQGVILLGDIHKDDTTSVAVDGIILPSKKELSIDFDAKNANGRFLRKYLDKIAPGFRGEVTGKLRLHGDFKDVTVAGNVMVRDGGFGIEFLNTYYTFNDSVYLSDDKISVSNLALYDREGRKAIANGTVRHDYFSAFSFRADILADNFLAFNGSEIQNPFFYGTAYGTGNVSLSGTEDEVDINLSMRTDEKTKISLNFMKQADIDEYDFINFVPPKKERDDPEEERDAFPTSNKANTFDQSGTTIRMNLNLEATPDAQIEFYVDPVSGDKIKAWGKGKLRIQYGNRFEPRIYGAYTLDRGVYNFSLQQVIFKDFHIQEGSSLTFSGDPYSANLNITASHILSANLTDLDPSFALETPMSTVTVNCILNINGALEQPAIRFDLKLPYSTSDLERQVKNVISTEEMMNRQMIFLLALGRFYTLESSSSTSSPNDFASVASSTLSSQLNNLLGDLNENFQIGTDIRTNNYDEYSDTEVKLLLSSQLLNNRLIINGNLGYKDNPVSDQRFVGDFDLEYKLTKSGDIRLKAYNHYNDKYYYLKTTTKQGVGVMFRRDFDNLYDLLRIKKKKQPDNYPDTEAAPGGEENFIRFKQN